MKTYLYPAGRVLSTPLSQSLKKYILLLLFIALAALSFATGGGGKLNFKNSHLVSGQAKQDGAVYRFPDVDTDFDALVKIKARSSALVYLVNLDMSNKGFDKAWQPQVGYNNNSAPGAADWWMDFEMTFVKKGTDIPVIINEFDLTAIDIDGNGHLIREYIGFYGLSSYILEATSVLSIIDLSGLIGGLTGVIGKRFNGPTTNFTDIDTSGTTVMTTAKYLNTTTYTLRIGGMSLGASSSTERMYSLYFKDFQYNQPQQSTLPVKLKSFDAKLASNKAMLNWVSSAEINFSHYILERSMDGRNYSDVTMVFGNSSQVGDLSYSYSEDLGKVSSGLYYYRLKLVDIDGSYKYSKVRILKLNSKNAGVAVTTYPNPVANELRITIPSEWQDRKVVYDMFSTNGKMVKRVVSNSASQTETIYLNDIHPGTYVIRLSSGAESAVQQIVKSK